MPDERNYETAPDTAHSDLIHDHEYTPREKGWKLCEVCGLGRATHMYGPPYMPDTSTVDRRDHICTCGHKYYEHASVGANQFPCGACRCQNFNDGADSGRLQELPSDILAQERKKVLEDEGLITGPGEDLAAVEEAQKKIREYVDPPTLPTPENILEEANRLTRGNRQEDYGHPIDDFTRTAALWKAILGVDITPYQVAICMILVKVSRETNRPKRDNIVDIAGYARTLEMCYERGDQR